MDSNKSEKSESGKLKLKSSSYTPSVVKKQDVNEFDPTSQPQQEIVNDQQVYYDPQGNAYQYQNQEYADPNAHPMNEFDDQMQYYGPEYDQNYQQEPYYNDQDPNFIQHDQNYINQEGFYDQEATDYTQNDQIHNEFPTHEQFIDEQAALEKEDQLKYGEKTKKPQGNKRKEKYHGKHHENYDESTEGFYDELGFYYLPDGSFYDPDGYYFDQEGYGRYGGYYDENAVFHGPYEQQFKGKKNKKYNNYQNYEEYNGAGEDYYEEEADEKYTEDYIQYIIESKFYEDLEYLQNAYNEWAYLKIGNLMEGTTKQDLLKYFGKRGIQTNQITIVMGGPKYSPTGNCEIYDISVALQVLKLCGDILNNKKVIIEVDQENEQAYGNSDSYNDHDEYDVVYDKYDRPEMEKNLSKGQSNDTSQAK